MHCLENIERINYPVDLVMNITELYKYKGKDFYYANIFKNEMNRIIKSTIENDAYYAGKLLELKISDSRIKAILKKDSLPKTNDEKMLFNLKKVFKKALESKDGIDLISNDFLEMAKILYEDIKKISFKLVIKETKTNLFTDKKKVSKREDLEKLLNLYEKAKRYKKAETTQLITNFYVDFNLMDIFNEENDFIGLVVLYCMILREQFYVFRYQSFFEKYYSVKDKFKTALAECSYNWKDGYSKTSMLNSLIISMMLEGYGKIENEIQNKKFDKNLKKVENIQTVILKMNEIFTKDDIKKKMPDVSESTINRALKQLKEENKIKSNGTGRSATWSVIVKDGDFRNFRQMNIDDIININNEEES